MVIPQLNKTPQDWRKPTYIKKRNRNKILKRKKALRITKEPRTYRRQSRNKKIYIKRTLSILIPIFIFLILLSGIIGIGALAWVSRDLPSPEGVINRNVSVSTKIYDRTGKTVLYDIHGDIKRTLVDLNEVPEHVIQATIAAEDRDFYNHKGFSITGIIRSVIKNIFTGSRVGGSTLTQQFVKNAILTTEKTYIRKIKELLISYRLEQKFTKDEILQMYFNEIPYGSVIYGVEAASQSFFGKSAKDLSIAEGAILAAIPQAPTYYSPYGSNKDKLINRQRYIINSMVELNYISKDDGEKAKNEKIIFKPFSESIIAPHFVMYIREQLSAEYGEEFINQEGLKVYTSLDLDKQKIAEEAITSGVETNGSAYQFTNASLVAIDPKTGQILAMVGSADYFNNDIDGQVNVSTRPRQPGSSLKPIIYTSAFIKGYTPDTILYDVVTNFDNTGTKPYEPKNYNLTESGPVTIRKSLQGSLNIPAVKATYLAGIDNVLDLVDNLGYTTLQDRSRFGLSIVLGGGEVKLLEHVNSYATLANQGVYHNLSPILKIEDKNGRVLFKYKEKKRKVLEPEIANITSNILSDDEARAYVFGIGSKLTLPGRPVAAKTGTTNDYRDAWTIGYTPSIATGVWVGNNNNEKMKDGATGGTVAAPIWNEFMKKALSDTPVENFPQIEKIETGKPVLDGQETGEIKIKIDKISGKLATQYTPEDTIEELNIKEIHNILFYVDKDNPRENQPENPSNDPQFNNWESSVLRWAEEQGFDPYEGKEIPEEYDNIHKPEDKPNLIIITPLPKQTITEPKINIELSALANRGVEKIEYYIDNKIISTKNNTNDTILDISEFNNGFHTLTIKAKDDIENTDTKSIELNFKFPQTIPSLSWTSPKNNSTASFPLTLTANLINFEQIKKIDFYYQKESNKNKEFLTYKTPSEAQISLSWDNKPEAGTYIISGNIFKENGNKYTIEELKIIVK